MAPWWDIPRLLANREIVRRLDPDGPPDVHVLVAPGAEVRRLAALPGSFNPPTVAHTGLCHAALRAGCDGAVLVLSTRTVDKERSTGLLLEDRLLLLSELAQHANARPGPGYLCVAVVNRGLYVDQAVLLRRAWPDAHERAFVVGYDKIVQIFDPRYYDDRDAALTALFAEAGFLVAPRDEHGAPSLRALLARPENRRFASRVRYLPVPGHLRAVSSTQARGALPSGAPAAVPPLVQTFARATGAFQEPRTLAGGEQVDAYALRAALLDAAERSSTCAAWDARRVWRRALIDTSEGARLRAALRAADDTTIARLASPPG